MTSKELCFNHGTNVLYKYGDGIKEEHFSGVESWSISDYQVCTVPNGNSYSEGSLDIINRVATAVIFSCMLASPWRLVISPMILHFQSQHYRGSGHVSTTTNICDKHGLENDSCIFSSSASVQLFYAAIFCNTKSVACALCAEVVESSLPCKPASASYSVASLWRIAWTFGSFLIPYYLKGKCFVDAGYFINDKDVSGMQHIESVYNEVITTHESTKNFPSACTSRLKPSLVP